MVTVPASGSTSHRHPLAGKWSGYISGYHFKRRHIVITVNAKETGGTWRMSSTCYGPEHLKDISYGYHHYLRKLGRGAHCNQAGNIDCLKRAGAKLYDTVTLTATGAWDVTGKLRRVPVHHS